MSDEVDMRQVVKELPPQFLHCRDYGHSWTPFTVHRVGRDYDRVLRCTRCDTLRHQFVVRKTGRLEGGSHYQYPSGYLVNGSGYFSADARGIVRLASIAADEKEMR